MDYIKKLEEFKGATNGNEDSLNEQFEDLANYFLTKGHFLVNGERKIYICDVEFYYHEEEGSIKDWIMYHRNNHPNNKTKELGYLDIGQFNSHASGIDITFENEKKKYRAGMLIRGFKIVNTNPEPDKPLFDYSHEGKYDTRSTYFYDALLNCGNIADGFTVNWVKEDRCCKREENARFRKNVPEYKYENIKATEIKDGDKYFKVSKTIYKQCMRPWRYKLETITI